MAGERKGFLFRHFEKIVAVVVSVGVILTLLYMSTRTSGRKVEGLIERIETVTADLERDIAPPEVPVINYQKAWERIYRLAEPGDTREDVWWFHWPVYYSEVFVGVEKATVLKFKEPLALNSVEVQQEDPPGTVVRKVEHPVGMDYSQVKIWAGQEGIARIAGLSGKTQHIQLLVVDPRAGLRAEPPLALKVTAGLRGVELTFEPNPANKGAVVVQAYEVFRKRPRNLDAEFRSVARIPADIFELTPEAQETLQELRLAKKPRLVRGEPSERDEIRRQEEREAYLEYIGGLPAAMAPEAPYRQPLRRAPGRAPEVEEKNEYSWQDTDILRPGESYLYKVRTIAYLSHPKESEFTEALQVKTLPRTDFRFTGRSGEKLRFEVAVHDRGSRTVRRHEFYNAVGEEIGGVVTIERTGTVQNFLTGCYLVDFHRAVRLREVSGFRDRIIYLNRTGELEKRFRNEPAAPQLFAARPEEHRMTGGPRRPAVRAPWPEGVFERPR